MRALACGLALIFALPVAADAKVRIKAISTRADLVSGGDVLVRITGTRGRVPRVRAGRRDVTSAFAVRDGRVEGLVTGLRAGRTRLRARGARLTVTNHPRSGPVIAGPQIEPWECRTEEIGLGPPQDADCTVPTRVTYFYRSDDPAKRGFDPYDPDDPPADVATTTTDAGRTVPFVVKLEQGVLDRGAYAVASLVDGWTGKLLWPFGGDCRPRHATDVPVDPLGGMRLDQPGTGLDEAVGSIYGNGNAPAALARGYMVANHAHNKLGSQCNTTVSAEAILMLKEHIRETYGPIRWTIGAGSSGGSMQQHVIASAYPGLLDAIQPMGSFPDLWSTINEAEDCHLLNAYFATPAGATITQVQQDAVTGSMVGAGCRTQFDGPHGLGTPVVGNYAGMWMDPANAPGCDLPAAQVYPATGVRCTIHDYMVSVFGRRPDGFANRPYDNVGVQYGLHALRDGRISPEQFVAMNEGVGGLDIDWKAQPERSVADPAALRAAYRGGLMTHGRALARVPIIDIRGADNFEIHSDFHSYSLRERLDRANGHHDNQIIWTGARPLVGDPEAFNQAFVLADRWLERIAADTSKRPLKEKVRANRPPEAVDACWFEGRKVTDMNVCRAAFPYFGDPRIAAGGPLADDVLKCRLRPLDRTDYPAALTDAQFARLAVAFPGGVCDYSRPGVAQRPPLRWPRFGR